MSNDAEHLKTFGGKGHCGWDVLRERRISFQKLIMIINKNVFGGHFYVFLEKYPLMSILNQILLLLGFVI